MSMSIFETDKLKTLVRLNVDSSNNFINCLDTQKHKVNVKAIVPIGWLSEEKEEEIERVV